MNIKVNGTMTTATVKPKILDKDGFEKTPAYLAITFKVDLNQLTEDELGELLVSVALKDLHEIRVREWQTQIANENLDPSASNTEEDPKAGTDGYPSVEQVNRQVKLMVDSGEYEGWGLPDLSEKAREILQDDIPF